MVSLHFASGLNNIFKGNKKFKYFSSSLNQIKKNISILF